MIDATLRSRFLARVDRSGGPDACWEWRGSRLNAGYGRIGYRGKEYLAHRVAYEIAHGSLSSEAVVRHDCDNPPCVNPAHLLEGTHADNVEDKMRRGRQPIGPNHPVLQHPGCMPHGEQHHASKLTAEDVKEIRRRRASESGTSLARAFAVDPSTISDIISGRTWTHVE